jgi:prepilin-type N-terminal cleavage/methylation domain-containing protein
MKNRLKIKKAFTLAEVLITLLIIGVVASLVIPNIIQDTQDAELKTAWKKAYSEIAQATQKIMLDNGGTMKGIFTDSDVVKNVYKNYFSYTRDCNAGASSGKCWHKVNEYYYLYGDPYPSSGYSSIITSSGMFLVFFYNDNQCNDQIGTSQYYRCAGITVDVNGFKRPNTWGKDIFSVFILENRILPNGIPNDFGWNRYCVGPDDPNYRSSSNGGQGCSAKYLYQ